MNSTAVGALARVGPNAVLQVVSTVETELGMEDAARLLAAAGLDSLPAADGLMDERPAVRVHRALRREFPERAAMLAREAGESTARYILRHRIPAAAHLLLRSLPSALASRLLARAIARNAWTFVGSGRLHIESLGPPVFTIVDNPFAREEHVGSPLCDWHVAVFERLFRTLADARVSVVETTCCGAGGPVCRFEVRRTAERL